MSLPVINIEQMRQWEKATWETGQTEEAVIALVGKLIARRVRQIARPGDSVLIVGGKGHNGDDARAVEGHLGKRKTTNLRIEKPEEDLPKLQEALSAKPRVVVEGLFGIGLNRPLDQSWQEVIRVLNDSGRPILAVDAPSGLNVATGEPEGAAIKARWTLTLGAPKQGLLKASAQEFTGRLEVVPEIGLIPCPHTSDLQWVLPEDFDSFPPPRKVAAHKGTYGHVCLVAGSVGYHGASVLSGRGALQAKPGLVSLFTHEPAWGPVASQLQAVMVHPFRQTPELPEKTTGLLVGPGLASADLPKQLVSGLASWWKELPIPLIVDASALDWIPPGPVETKAVRVITPHPGEAGRMLQKPVREIQENRVKTLRELSRRYGNCCVVLKGYQTLTGHAEGTLYVNSSGGPGLAQGGSGDVLSGYLAGLLAQPILLANADQVIRYGVWQHGAVADLLQRKRENWTIEDLIPKLGGAPALCRHGQRD